MIEIKYNAGSQHLDNATRFAKNELRELIFALAGSLFFLKYQLE